MSFIDDARKRAEGARNRTQTYSQVGAALGSVIPGVGTAVGATAGTVAAYAQEILDLFGDAFGSGRSFQYFDDGFGRRMLPVGWRPDARFAWEKVPNGEILFNARRAQEDGVPRSQVLGYLAAAFHGLNPELSADLMQRARQQRADELDALSFKGFSTNAERAANPVLAAAEKVPANRDMVGRVYATAFLRRAGVGQLEAADAVRSKLGAGPGLDDGWEPRVAHARQAYLGGLGAEQGQVYHFADSSLGDRPSNDDGTGWARRPAPPPRRIVVKDDPAPPPRRVVVKQDPQGAPAALPALPALPGGALARPVQGPAWRPLPGGPMLQEVPAGGAERHWRASWHGHEVLLRRSAAGQWLGTLVLRTPWGPVTFTASASENLFRAAAQRAGISVGAYDDDDPEWIVGAVKMDVSKRLGNQVLLSRYRGPYGLSLVKGLSGGPEAFGGRRPNAHIVRLNTPGKKRPHLIKL